MGRLKININRNILKKLYLDKNLSPYKIGDILDCSFATVRNRLLEFGIPLKDDTTARTKYKKYDFDNNPIHKAYMTGFRIGDLHVRKPYENSGIIIVQCHTTHKEQVDIIHFLFDKFGMVSVSKGKENHYYVNCYLNNTFGFLLSKEVSSWRWVKNDEQSSAAFIAGYVDAEGNFILNQNRARFKIDSYDYEVLNWMVDWLNKNNIRNRFKCISKQGSERYGGGVWNKDLWRLNINYADCVEKFIKIVMPYLKHKRRIKHAKICLNNIKSRKINGYI